ncbi:hypothetical protein Celaphus_00009989 [Cervus elaphus hippelaphus]|uniref:AMER1 n=1 Tax=Cervus elaphus hippelaphus TaxID=46360 RepID=A0A212BZZ6_CEREH|nr:hypothetical protein Celaphus_00009989 [Cervus elaphus hippelaphus]
METQKDEAAQAKGTTVSMDTQDQGTEKGAKNKASEATERPASEPPSSGPGRLKKTAMKLFGGKKGICTLPSFFGGGRSKGSGKGSSKKGLSKSKTHDGLSEVVHDPEDIVSEGTGLSLPLPESSSRLPSSQSVHGSLETGSRCKRSVAGATEKAGVEKAHFVPKPKKGLKGFFSSIRRHRKSKVSGAEQSNPGAKKSEGARARPHEYVSSALPSHTDEVLQAPRKENAKSQDVPGPKMYPRPILNPGYHPTASPGHLGYMLLDPVRSYPGSAPGELLTPQSDQQESAPNSDEGYYDSTTPGLEDDSGEALGLVHRDCLPRDSYSGDALYEFYEPDDSLENSPPGDDCLYDLHGHSSEMFDPFLNFEPFSSPRPPGAMETEEERLVTIQKQLLYWELQREQREAREACAQEAHTREAHAREAHTREAYVREARPREAYARETCGQEVRAREAQVREAQVRQEKPIIEYQMRPLGPSVMGLVEGASGASQTSHRGTTSAFPATASSEPDWRDFRPLEKRFEGSCSKKDQSTCLMQLFQSDAMFEPDMQEANFGGSPRRAYPTYSPPEEPEEEDVEKEGNATVSFSQALVEFTSNGNLFSSMSCSSDSDSSFTQNLPELPPMVTFDIADVERDGEGKCEENPEFHNDEDLAASLEAFELGYYQKHAFNNYRSRFYQGLPWGVSSLPRYLGLPGMHPRPPPAAMALSRRSRSLDTAETLELELSNSHLTQGYMESDELQAQQEDSDEEEEEDEWDRDSPLSLYTEPPGSYDWPAWPPCPLSVGPGHAWISPSQLDGPSSHPYGQAVCCISPLTMSMLLSVSGPEPRAPGESKSQLARPSHLPLPMGPCYNLQPKASQSVRARPPDVLLPVDEPSCSSISGGFSPSPVPQAKPVGITHGIPQLPRIRPEPPEPQPIHYGAPSLDLSKEKAEQGASLPTSCSSTAMNGKLAE